MAGGRTADGVGVPDGTPGTTDEERASAYVGQIMTRVEAAFPTPFFAARLGDTPVARFLQANPAYDFRTTYPALFFTQNPAAAALLDADQQQHSRTFSAVPADGEDQRDAGPRREGHRVRAADHTPLAPGLRRSTRTMRSGGARGAVYDRALQVSAMALAVFGENAAA